MYTLAKNLRTYFNIIINYEFFIFFNMYINIFSTVFFR